MKIILILFLIVSSTIADAKRRPVIGLVLSGGAAKGGAHVGVLRVLEQKHIPIDFIVGTSMGSFVGGLYASGKSPQEIEDILVKTNWKKYIRTDYERQEMPMRKKEVEYQYQGRLGLGINTKNKIVLPTGVLKRQPMLLKFQQEFQSVEDIKDFDKLPIPFRAVATNIENGEAVVLSSGSIAKSVYASSAIPGGFQPININGLDLVDGGVSDNIPIGVAREMGADIIIAVDVSENFDKDLDVNSYFVVMNQLVNILMRKNANKSIATLSDKDILITPDLKGIGGLEVEKYAEIIQKGEDITNELYNSKLKKLSISVKEYAQYKKGSKLNYYFKEPKIQKIVLNNSTKISDDVILGQLNIQIGDILVEDKLRKKILDLYNLGYFDVIDYDIVKEDGKNILYITTTPSWDSNGEIRFALGLEDDFGGHSAYTLKVGYTMFGVNDFGAEWKNDLQIGRKKKAYSELYQPLSPMQKFYTRTSIIYEDTNELVPAKTLGIANSGNLEVDIRRYGASFGLGTYILDDYELEGGISTYQDELKLKLLNLTENYDAVPLYITLKTDSLDNLNFPNTGLRSGMRWIKEMKSLGSDYEYEQIYVDIEKPINFNNHNFTTYIKYGSTYKQKGITSLAGSFTLGGLFNLSGYVPYSFNNDNMFLGVVKYRYKLRDSGFFGSLNAPVYAGFSAEVGNTWALNDSVSYNMMKKSGTLYLAADTFLGPLYLAYGFSNTKDNTLYLYLGEKF